MIIEQLAIGICSTATRTDIFDTGNNDQIKSFAVFPFIKKKENENKLSSH